MCSAYLFRRSTTTHHQNCIANTEDWQWVLKVQTTECSLGPTDKKYKLFADSNLRQTWSEQLAPLPKLGGAILEKLSVMG